MYKERETSPKKVTVLGACLLLAAALTGCGTSGDQKSGAAAAPHAEAASSTAKFGAVERKEDASPQGAGAANQAADKALGTAINAGQAGFSPSGTAPDLGASSEGLNRKLIYKANLTMKVKDYSQAQSKIRDLTALSGGYVLQFTETGTTHEVGGQLVLKIPASGFASFLKELEKLPHLNLQQSMQGQDVSEEYVDLEARLKAKQVVEARYLEFMQKATKTDDLVAFTNELGKIQEQIEQIKGRMRYIDQNVAYSTVEIRVYQPEGIVDNNGSEGEGQGVFTKARIAMNTSLNVLSSAGQGIVVAAAALLPLMAAAAVVGIPVVYVVRRRRTVRRNAAEKARLERVKINREVTEGGESRQENSPSDTERQQEEK